MTDPEIGDTVQCPECGEQVTQPIVPGDVTKISRNAACGHWVVFEYDGGDVVGIRSTPTER